MNGKEYLQSVALYKERMEQARLDNELRLEELAEIKAVDYSEYKAGSTRQVNADVALAVEKRAKLREQLQSALLQCTQDYFERYIEATTVIRMIKNATLSSLLYKRYIQGMSWDEVSYNLNYEKTYACGPLHKKALKEFERAYSEYKRANN